jgi:hypothetical protein
VELDPGGGELPPVLLPPLQVVFMPLAFFFPLISICARVCLHGSSISSSFFFLLSVKNWIGNPFVVGAEFGLEPAVYLRFRPFLPAAALPVRR